MSQYNQIERRKIIQIENTQNNNKDKIKTVSFDLQAFHRFLWLKKHCDVSCQRFYFIESKYPSKLLQDFEMDESDCDKMNKTKN